jgi:hypothetical protein
MVMIVLLVALVWGLGLAAVVGLCLAARAGDLVVVCDEDDTRFTTAR